MYIVSSCLLGEDCKYNGKNNFNKAVKKFLQGKDYIAVCPEVLGGLPTPRTPAEIQEGGGVINKDGEDVTLNFVRGAQRALEMAMEQGRVEGAILKAKSPSCGRDYIYDGTFSGVLTEGDGLFAALLKKTGIQVITEKEIDDGKF